MNAPENQVGEYCSNMTILIIWQDTRFAAHVFLYTTHLYEEGDLGRKASALAHHKFVTSGQTINRWKVNQSRVVPRNTLSSQSISTYVG